ncbi:MAG: 5-formyltetrahydrofolate cyclo-ligase [Prochloraceae cyanobacterium]|nr:5-formyltetrahydrofolate cyclo-ligase [Prochloraceae cyanobacterium]
MQLNKAQLRRLLLEKRRALPPNVWRQKSDILCDRLSALSIFREAKTILAYLSFRQEPDLAPLFTSDRRWGFPRCLGKSLQWHSWMPGESLEVGTYGILEPLVDSPTISSEEVDLILVPAVGCDRQRYRLGYGGGFYDRMLTCPQWNSKPTIGIVFDFAYLPQLPVDPWDRQLSYICTDSEQCSQHLPL